MSDIKMGGGGPAGASSTQLVGEDPELRLSPPDDTDDGTNDVPRQKTTAPPATEPEDDSTASEIEQLLASQFGGFSFFLQKHRDDLMIGVTADGTVVNADSPDAVSTKNVLDYIVDEGITAVTRVKGILENTKWWQDTDSAMRAFDTRWMEMSEPEKQEFLEPIIDNLEKEAQFLGAEIDPSAAYDLAKTIARLGEQDDTEYIRGALVAELEYDPSVDAGVSDFAASVDDVQAMSRRYFVPISETDAAAFAQEIYTGERTAGSMEQYFKEMAINTFPALQTSIENGVTPEQYFAPYKYQIEQMLDRPNVDIYEEFPELVSFQPEGGGPVRPMTLSEARKHIRGQREWQNSEQGTNAARALSNAIGQTFGEVA